MVEQVVILFRNIGCARNEKDFRTDFLINTDWKIIFDDSFFRMEHSDIISLFELWLFRIHYCQEVYLICLDAEIEKRK